MKLSLIVPCYNEEESVENFINEVNEVFKSKVDDYEFVFVDDGSKDKTYSLLKKIHDENPKHHIQVLSFSRNFGKESAMYAGLKNATGDLVCIIDADLQQRPEVVLEMLDKINEDESIDCVSAYQEKRKENKIVSFLKKCFYKIINKVSDINLMADASDFRLMKRNMVDAIINMTEHHRFSKGIFSYVGFKTVFIPYTVQKRQNGTSKWNVKKLFKYAFEGIISFSSSPLKIANFIGSLSFVGAIVYLIVTLCGGHALTGTYLLTFLLLIISALNFWCAYNTCKSWSILFARASAWREFVSRKQPHRMDCGGSVRICNK